MLLVENYPRPSTLLVEEEAGGFRLEVEVARILLVEGAECLMVVEVEVDSRHCQHTVEGEPSIQPGSVQARAQVVVP